MTAKAQPRRRDTVHNAHSPPHGDEGGREILARVESLTSAPASTTRRRIPEAGNPKAYAALFFFSDRRCFASHDSAACHAALRPPWLASPKNAVRRGRYPADVFR
jgi:hypothetical protein